MVCTLSHCRNTVRGELKLPSVFAVKTHLINGQKINNILVQACGGAADLGVIKP